MKHFTFKNSYFHPKSRLSLVLMLALTGLFLYACKPDKKAGKDFKLDSKGGLLEIIVVMDSSRWAGSTGEALREVYMEPQPGLPRGEARFKLIRIGPKDFNRFLKRHNSVIMVTILNDNSSVGKRMKAYFTPASLNMIKSDTSKFMLGRDDEFARGQKVLYLFGQSVADINRHILENEEKLREYFYEPERTRVLKRQLGASTTKRKELKKLVKDETGLRMEIPGAFEVAKTDSNFVWLRRIASPYDRSITITYGNYSSQEMFSDSSIVKWRNHFGYQYMNDTTLNESYMHTQDDVIPIESRTMNINGQFVKEYRGLWKLKNNTRGGPFLGYAFIDEKQKRFYYVEGFLYAPNESQKRPMFELESVLRTAIP